MDRVMSVSLIYQTARKCFPNPWTDSYAGGEKGTGEEKNNAQQTKAIEFCNKYIWIAEDVWTGKCIYFFDIFFLWYCGWSLVFRRQEWYLLPYPFGQSTVSACWLSPIFLIVACTPGCDGNPKQTITTYICWSIEATETQVIGKANAGKDWVPPWPPIRSNQRGLIPIRSEGVPKGYRADTTCITTEP